MKSFIHRLWKICSDLKKPWLLKAVLCHKSAQIQDTSYPKFSSFLHCQLNADTVEKKKSLNEIIKQVKRTRQVKAKQIETGIPGVGVD